jgi:hypothetical protein
VSGITDYGRDHPCRFISGGSDSKGAAVAGTLFQQRGSTTRAPTRECPPMRESLAPRQTAWRQFWNTPFGSEATVRFLAEDEQSSSRTLSQKKTFHDLTLYPPNHQGHLEVSKWNLGSPNEERLPFSINTTKEMTRWQMAVKIANATLSLPTQSSRNTECLTILAPRPAQSLAT